MRKSIFNGREVSFISSDNMDMESIYETNSFFWGTVGNDVVGATALPKYGAYITEDNHRLFGDVSGKKLLEIRFRPCDFASPPFDGFARLFDFTK